MKDLKNLPKGTKVINRFQGLKNSPCNYNGRTAIILSQDEEGDYWCFYPNTAYGDSLTDEEDEYLESLGIDEFGTCAWCFPEWMEVVED